MRSLLVSLILLTGCISPVVDKANDDIKDRLNQLDNISKERVAEVKMTVGELKLTVGDIAEKYRIESEKWRDESGMWRHTMQVEADKTRTMLDEQSEQLYAQSELWRKTAQVEAERTRAALKDQSDLWRKTMESEAEKTRVFVAAETEKMRVFIAAQQAKGTEDLNKIVDKVPVIIQSSTSKALNEGSSKLGLIKDPETGEYSLLYTIMYVIGGVGASGGLFSFAKTWWRKKKGVEMYDSRTADKKFEERLNKHAARLEKLAAAHEPTKPV